MSIIQGQRGSENVLHDAWVLTTCNSSRSPSCPTGKSFAIASTRLMVPPLGSERSLFCIAARLIAIVAPFITPATRVPGGRPRMTFSLALNTGGDASNSFPCSDVTNAKHAHTESKQHFPLVTTKSEEWRVMAHRFVKGNGVSKCIL